MPVFGQNTYMSNLCSVSFLFTSVVRSSGKHFCKFVTSVFWTVTWSQIKQFKWLRKCYLVLPCHINSEQSFSLLKLNISEWEYSWQLNIWLQFCTLQHQHLLYIVYSLSAVVSGAMCRFQVRHPCCVDRITSIDKCSHTPNFLYFYLTITF